MILGLNTDVRYRGKTFHLQTEDSGVQNPVLLTHIFLGGSIIGTRRSEYGEVLERSDLEEYVRGLMRRQHREAYQALLSGEFDKSGRQGPSAGLSHIPLARKKGPVGLMSESSSSKEPLPQPEVEPEPSPSPFKLKPLPEPPKLEEEKNSEEGDDSMLGSVDMFFVEDESISADESYQEYNAEPLEYPSALMSGLSLDRLLLSHLLEEEAP